MWLFKPKQKSHQTKLRKSEVIEVKMAHTQIYYESAVPFIQRKINKHELHNNNDKISERH